MYLTHFTHKYNFLKVEIKMNKLSTGDCLSLSQENNRQENANYVDLKERK